jgi:GrpB-like predicted nucleotidyltransferase (UPF0157 family)
MAKRFLEQLLPFPIEMEHVGSSAVPGLGGKRVIDTLVLCPKERMREVVSHLESAGYTFNPAEGAGTFQDKFFVSGWFPCEDDAFHVHYHITFKGSQEHRNKLLFRDHLRRHPDVADEYCRMKKEGCIVKGDDVRSVWDKEPFVTDVLDKARRESPGARPNLS